MTDLGANEKLEWWKFGMMEWWKQIEMPWRFTTENMSFT
jgi:hypothetical protein